MPVALSARSHDKLDALAAELCDNAVAIPADLTVPAVPD